MELTRRSLVVYVILGAVWALVGIWQAEEHFRVNQAARTDLSYRSKDIANTVSACLRGMRFRGTILQERLEPVLQELVNGRSNELVKASELVSLALLNAAGEPVATAGREIDFTQKEILQHGERWGQRTVTFVNPVDLGSALSPEGTNPVVVLPPMRSLTNSFRDGPRPPPRNEADPSSPPPPPGEEGQNTNPPPPRPREGESRPRRPPWFRGMDEQEFHSLREKRGLHGLVIAMSTEQMQAAMTRDLWLRALIVTLAGLAALGSGLAWRNLVTSSDLQMRLLRASELNTHLKEMNLAAAGLAHETRNPLNIIRGRAQMISKLADLPPETQEKAREITDEVDKVTAQLNEFINYSRPREVRRAAISLGTAAREVVRALSYDLEEKQVQLELTGEQVQVEADEQLLRQALFNLLLNAIQAVDPKGQIQIVIEKRGTSEAALEIRDNGPGVPPDRRQEVFRPYFTTQKQGTGLGLAVVQQIVLAHGWEIECLANEPKGAVFRITHLKTVA